LTILATLAPFNAVRLPNPVSSSHHFEYLFTFHLGNQTFSSSSQEATILSSLLGLNLGQLTGQIGASCTPIEVIGAGQGASW